MRSHVGIRVNAVQPGGQFNWLTADPGSRRRVSPLGTHWLSRSRTGRPQNRKSNFPLPSRICQRSSRMFGQVQSTDICDRYLQRLCIASFYVKGIFIFIILWHSSISLFLVCASLYLFLPLFYFFLHFPIILYFKFFFSIFLSFVTSFLPPYLILSFYHFVSLPVTILEKAKLKLN